MNASSVRAASMCGGTPTATAAAAGPAMASARRRAADTDGYYSRRSSQCYSEISTSSRQTVGGGGNGAYDAREASAAAQQRGWTSYRTDVTGTSIRTPMSSGKFRTHFSFRQAQVPEGYPKMEHERNPRRESFVSEFSRKLAEGYDIWEDEDRPVINWVFPRLPIRKNKTHELRMMANRERISKMLEREKQMNKRSTRLTAATDKKETAWWERRNGVSRTPASHAGGHAMPGTPRSQINRGWSSNVSARQNFTTSSRGSYYGSRR